MRSALESLIVDSLPTETQGKLEEPRWVKIWEKNKSGGHGRLEESNMKTTLREKKAIQEPIISTQNHKQPGVNNPLQKY